MDLISLWILQPLPDFYLIAPKIACHWVWITPGDNLTSSTVLFTLGLLDTKNAWQENLHGIPIPKAMRYVYTSITYVLHILQILHILHITYILLIQLYLSLRCCSSHFQEKTSSRIRYGSLFSPHRSSSRKAGRTVGSSHPRREALDLRTMSIFIYAVCHTVCCTAG